MSGGEFQSPFCGLQRISPVPNILPDTSDSTESCSRTTKIGILGWSQSQGGNQRFILPKGLMTQHVENEETHIISANTANVKRKSENLNSTKTQDSLSDTVGLEKSVQRYKIKRLQICCICSSLPDIKRGLDLYDIQTEEQEGKKLVNVLVSVLGSEAWEELQQVSSHICNTCTSLLDRIDRQRSELDKDCSHLRDLYQSSQIDIESDLYGENSSLSSLVSGYHFNCKVLDISQGLVANTTDLSCPVIATHYLASGHEGGQTATLYCSPLEWEESCGEVRASALETLCGGCYMGQGDDNRSLTLSVISPRVLEEIILETDHANPFLCGNCEKSFSKLYLLMSHIQFGHNHVLKEEKKSHENGEMYKITSSISDAGDKGTRIVPSLQRPFQCEACEKCFSDYNNMMSHVEHYHGWSRQCNVGTCQKRLSSIAEFVTHHVQHYDSTFSIPKNNSARNNCICICPVCKKISSGVNRHWEHSFIHDKVARFKCPLCDRRVNKVQNLKDHIKRHMGPASRTKKCEDCEKMFCPADIYKHRKKVHGKKDVRYYCNICCRSVPLIHKFEHKLN